MGKNSTLPPWLWLWLILYFLQTPDRIYYWESLWNGSFTYTRFENLPELISSLALFLGSISIFFPLFRANWIKKMFKLDDFDIALSVIPEINKTTALEIKNFLNRHAPALEVKANFSRFDMDPFIYSSAKFKPSIALFGNILKLWKTDQKVAESILLHEIGHYKNGDALIVGSGNFVEFAIKTTIIAGLILIVSIILFQVSQSSIFSYGIPSYSLLILAIRNMFFLYLTAITSISSMLLLNAVVTFSILIGGIWCAELNADRYMLKESDSLDGPLRALTRISEDTSTLSWLYSMIFHPPRWFRKWMINDSKRIEIDIALLLLFPLAYYFQFIVHLFLYFVMYMGFYPMGINYFSGFVGTETDTAQSFLQSSSSIFFLSSFLILVWPIISIHWLRFLSGETENVDWTNYKSYLVSSGIVLFIFSLNSFI